MGIIKVVQLAAVDETSLCSLQHLKQLKIRFWSFAFAFYLFVGCRRPLAVKDNAHTHIHTHSYFPAVPSSLRGCRDLLNSGGICPLRIVMQIKMQSKDKTRIDLLVGNEGWVAPCALWNRLIALMPK